MQWQRINGFFSGLCGSYSQKMKAYFYEFQILPKTNSNPLCQLGQLGIVVQISGGHQIGEGCSTHPHPYPMKTASCCCGGCEFGNHVGQLYTLFLPITTPLQGWVPSRKSPPDRPHPHGWLNNSLTRYIHTLFLAAKDWITERSLLCMSVWVRFGEGRGIQAGLFKIMKIIRMPLTCISTVRPIKAYTDIISCLLKREEFHNFTELSYEWKSHQHLN